MVLGTFEIALCLRHWIIFLWMFSILKLWGNFSGKQKLFSKNWSTDFYLKVLRFKTQHFHTKLSCRLMLREMEWEFQNLPMKENRVLPVTTLFFWKFLFQGKNLIKSWFDVLTTLMSTFILVVSVGFFSLRIHWKLFLSTKVVLWKFSYDSW